MKPARARTRPRGVAIVLAMGTVAMATMAATAIMTTQATWARRNELGTQHVQAQIMVQTGTDWACAVLNDDRRMSNTDHLGEPWALRLPPMPVENGSLAGYLEDQQGRFNLNNLVSDGKVNAAQLASFLRLLALVGVSGAQAAALGDALADWIDADGSSRQGGNEDDFYLALQPPYLPANRPLTNEAELLLVRGFDESLRTRLQPFISALPRATATNVNTAPAEVLAAVVEGLTLDDARALVARRTRAYFRDAADFVAALPRGASRDEGGIAVSSDYFRAWMTVTVGDAQARGTALLARQGAAWPNIVWSKLL